MLHTFPKTLALISIAAACVGSIITGCADETEGETTSSAAQTTSSSTSSAGGASATTTNSTTSTSGGGMGGTGGVGGMGDTGGASGTGGSAPANPMSFIWDDVYSGPGSAMATDVAVDAFGNVVVVGGFTGSFDFGGGTLTSSNGGADTNVFVAKYLPTGTFAWAKTYGSGSEQLAYAVAVDGQGDIGLCGAFRGAIGFGGAVHMSEAQGSDIFFAKLSTMNGGLMFSGSFAGEASTDDVCRGAAFDNGGSLWLTGTHEGSRNFGAGSVTANGRDVFVVKLSLTGYHMASAQFGAGGTDEALDIATAINGDIGLVGHTDGSLDFGAGAIPNSQGERAFLARLTNNLAVVHADIISGDGEARATQVAFAVDGSMYVAGDFSTTIDVGGGAIAAMGANPDIFTARYTTAGVLLYGVRLGSVGSEHVYGLAADGSGHAVLAGSFDDELTVNSTTKLVSAGLADGFIVTLDMAGVGFAGYGFGDAEVQTATATAVAPDNTLLLVGNFSGDLDLGSGSVGGGFASDIFVAKFSD